MPKEKINLLEVVETLNEDAVLQAAVLKNKMPEIINSADEDVIEKIADIFVKARNFDGIWHMYCGANGKKDFVVERYSKIDKAVQKEIAVKFLSEKEIECKRELGLEFAIWANDNDLIAKGSRPGHYESPVDILQRVVKSENYEATADIFLNARRKIRFRPGEECVREFIEKNEHGDGWDWKGPVEALYKILEQIKEPKKALEEVTKKCLADAIDFSSQKGWHLGVALESALRAKNPDLILNVSLQAAATRNQKHSIDYSFREANLIAFEGFNALLTQYEIGQDVREKILAEVKETARCVLQKYACQAESLNAALEAVKLTGDYEPVKECYYGQLELRNIERAKAIASAIPNLKVNQDRVIEIANSRLDKVKEPEYSGDTPNREVIERAIEIAELTDKTLNKEKLSHAIVIAMADDRKGVMSGLKYLAEKNIATNAQQKLYQAMQQNLI